MFQAVLKEGRSKGQEEAEFQMGIREFQAVSDNCMGFQEDSRGVSGECRRKFSCFVSFRWGSGSCIGFFDVS